MGSPGFAVSGANVDLLVGELNLQFQQEGGAPPNIDLSDVLFVDRPGMGQNGGFISMDGVYPLTVIGYDDKAKADTALRDFGEAGVIEIGPIRAARRDGPAVMLPTRPGYDKYGLIMAEIPRMARWGQHLWLWLLARMMVNSPPNSYDGVPLFGAGHKINQLDPGTELVSNSLPKTDLDEAGVAAAMDRLLSFRNLDGKTLANAGMAQPTIMVPTMSLYIKALHLFGFPGALVPNAAGTAPQTTVLAGAAKVVLNPYLLSEATNKVTAAKNWFMISDVGRKLAIVREEVPPMIEMTTSTDFPRHQRDARLAYIEAYCAVGPGEWRSGVQAQTP